MLQSAPIRAPASTCAQAQTRVPAPTVLALAQAQRVDPHAGRRQPWWPTARLGAASATRSCCAAVMPGYSGSDRISVAARSATGNSPGRYPEAASAPVTCTGTG